MLNIIIIENSISSALLLWSFLIKTIDIQLHPNTSTIQADVYYLDLP